jgi:predicted DCC family thiol-disulfide oxidoreductase YuxK
MTAGQPPTGGPVLLFDGECGLCNRCVRWLLRLDPAARLRFAPLQSPGAQHYLQAQGLPTQDFDSLVFVADWGRSTAPELRTDGVLAALRQCNRFGRALAAIASVIPAGWRDRVYKLVARWRYRIWGEWQPRPLARPEWAARFFQ